MYRSPLPASIYGCARMTDAGLPFDTSHTAHATRSATSLAKAGAEQERSISVLMTSCWRARTSMQADFYAGGAVERALDARSASMPGPRQRHNTNNFPQPGSNASADPGAP